MLLGRLYHRLGDWENLGKLLPKLRKHGRLEPSVLDEWSLRVYCEQLDDAADGEALEAIKAIIKLVREHGERDSAGQRDCREPCGSLAGILA